MLSAKRKEYMKRWREKNRDKERLRHRLWRQEHPEATKAFERNGRLRIKMEVLGHYSLTDTPSCNHCGFSDLRALSIDHINGGGTRHCKEVGAGKTFYYWLRKQGFPEGYQTLCANCQRIKQFENNEFSFKLEIIHERNQ